MPLAYEHVGSKKPAKINTYMHTRAELLITLCYEIPCKMIMQLVDEKKVSGPKYVLSLELVLKSLKSYFDLNLCYVYQTAKKPSSIISNFLRNI